AHPGGARRGRLRPGLGGDRRRLRPPRGGAGDRQQGRRAPRRGRAREPGAGTVSGETLRGGVAVVANYDLFTYNLVQSLGELGPAPAVFRNDALSAADLAAMEPAA